MIRFPPCCFFKSFLEFLFIFRIFVKVGDQETAKKMSIQHCQTLEFRAEMTSADGVAEVMARVPLVCPRVSS